MLNVQLEWLCFTSMAFLFTSVALLLGHQEHGKVKLYIQKYRKSLIFFTGIYLVLYTGLAFHYLPVLVEQWGEIGGSCGLSFGVSGILLAVISLSGLHEESYKKN